MRFIYLFLTIIISSYGFTQENNLSLTLEKNHNDIFLYKDEKIDEESNVSFNCYSQVITYWSDKFCRSILVPIGIGCGASVRFHQNNQPFGLQLDGNAYTIAFIRSHYIQTSTSAIYYPFYYIGNDSLMNRLNLTFGAALHYELEDDYPIFMLPLSIGYQGEELFFDIGIPSVIPNDFIGDHVLQSQTIKIGIRF